MFFPGVWPLPEITRDIRGEGTEIGGSIRLVGILGADSEWFLKSKYFNAFLVGSREQCGVATRHRIVLSPALPGLDILSGL